MSGERQGLEGWVILELMGHRRLAGHVTETTVAGAPMLRIDIPRGERETLTQFYGGSAIYCITPCSEELARRVAASTVFAGPVHEYELRLTPGGNRDEHEDADVVDDDPEE